LVIGVGNIDPMSSPVVTSYRLPIVAIGLQLYLSPFSQASDLSRTDKRTDEHTELV